MYEAIKDKKIRNSIIFTLLMLIIFAVGSNIPVPGIDRSVLNEAFNNDNTGLFELFNLFTGGSFQNFTIFALGVTPYITASIIIQLFTIAFPYFEQLSKEGESGRKKMSTITRYFTVVLSIIQAAGITLGLFRNSIMDKSVLNIIMILLLLTAGTTFLMWLGEQINEYGVGNGMSLLIFAGIAIRLPVDVKNIAGQVAQGTISYVTMILIIVFAILIVASIVFVTQGIRKIPVQYARRVVGRKSFGGQNTHIPIKVNHAGVIPIIFSLSILQFPITIAYFFPNSAYQQFITKWLSPNGNPGIWFYVLFNIVLIVLFTYFYTNIVFKTDEVAKNLSQSGGSIPGIRPGKDTDKYLHNISNRLCLASGLFLALVSTLPTLVSGFSTLNLTFGGTSLIILVGVALDTMQQINNKMVLNQHQGFLR